MRFSLINIFSSLSSLARVLASIRYIYIFNVQRWLETWWWSFRYRIFIRIFTLSYATTIFAPSYRCRRCFGINFNIAQYWKHISFSCNCWGVTIELNWFINCDPEWNLFNHSSCLTRLNAQISSRMFFGMSNKDNLWTIWLLNDINWSCCPCCYDTSIWSYPWNVNVRQGWRFGNTRDDKRLPCEDIFFCNWWIQFNSKRGWNNNWNCEEECDWSHGWLNAWIKLTLLLVSVPILLAQAWNSASTNFVLENETENERPDRLSPTFLAPLPLFPPQLSFFSL